MVNHNELLQQDLKHIWHPCTQMKSLEHFPPLIIQHAKGSYLYTDRGPIIDGISSWWCKSLGHGHPAVIGAIKDQLSHFEHIIGADTTFPKLVELGEKLARISQLQHVFFASDGACAVEIAMKLALHANQLQGHPTRNQFIALQHGYHGETLGTLSVSDLGIYKKPYNGLNVKCHFVQPIPYVNHPQTPLWSDAEQEWRVIEQQLEAVKEQACAVIFEPIVQGAGGMRVYSADFLHRLVQWAKANRIYVIADEIMTGLGRTGKWLASEHASIKPDMVCLSKGLTSGSLPLSCVLIDDPIYNLFYHEASEGKSFLHSHTYSGNPLGIRAALATIDVMHAEGINEQAQALGECMLQHFSSIASQTAKLTNVRSIGAIVAGDFVGPVDQQIGFTFQQEALNRGALLRPLGNTLYWLPPLTTTEETIEKLAEITLHSINAVYKNTDYT